MKKFLGLLVVASFIATAAYAVPSASSIPAGSVSSVNCRELKAKMEEAKLKYKNAREDWKKNCKRGTKKKK